MLTELRQTFRIVWPHPFLLLSAQIILNFFPLSISLSPGCKRQVVQVSHRFEETFAQFVQSNELIYAIKKADQI